MKEQLCKIFSFYHIKIRKQMTIPSFLNINPKIVRGNAYLQHLLRSTHVQWF